MKQQNLSLIYVWDAYCGWCHGFARSLQEFHENHPELPLTILSAGSFLSQPIGNLTHIPEANQRIQELTGAEFGPDYQSLLKDGTFIMDSEGPAIGFAALRSFAPDRANHFALAMQHAFYFNGKSLSNPETYREIAVANGLDPEAVVAKMGDEAFKEEARSDFVKVKQLGVTNNPTLLLQKGEEVMILARGALTLENLEANFESLTS